MISKLRTQKGFTIVELLIVIVIIGILAAITVVAYTEINSRSQQAKISADLKNLHAAILNSRQSSGSVTLRTVTGSTATGTNCWSKPTNTDLAALARTDSCWTAYALTLSRLSAASGIDVNGLVDPWGRPYYIDENEGEGANPSIACNDDWIGYYSQPFTTGQTMTKSIIVANIQPACL